MAEKGNPGLSIKGHSIVALIILLVGLPIMTAYVMDISAWFEGDTTPYHGSWSQVNETGVGYPDYDSDDATAHYNNLTSSGLTCPQEKSFYWIENGSAAYVVPAAGNASERNMLYCGWSGTLDFGGIASGTYGGAFQFGNNNTTLAKQANADDMVLIGMAPCNIDNDRPAGPLSNAALGHVSCGYDDYKIGLPSSAFPTDTAMVGFHFVVSAGVIYGYTPCNLNFKISYKWELALDDNVFADGSEEHWNLQYCHMAQIPSGGPFTGHPYVQINTDLDIVEVAYYSELIKGLSGPGEFTMRVYDFYDETNDVSLECNVYDIGCELALHYNQRTAFDGSLDIADGIYHPQCSATLLGHVAATDPFECPMKIGIVVHSADFTGANGFTLGLFTWGLGATFMVVAVASTSLWDPFKSKAKEVVVNAGP